MSQTTFRILLIGDDVDGRSALSGLLSGLGGCTVGAVSSTDAEPLHSNGLPPHLVVLDAPTGTAGLEAAHRLIRDGQTQGAPILLLSPAFDAEAFARLGLPVDAVDCLCKPAANSLLLSRVAVYQRWFEQEQRLAEAAARLASTEERLQLSDAVIRNMSDAMMILEADETISGINPAFTRTTGYSEAQAIGRPASLLDSGRHDAGFFDAMRRSLRETGQWKGEIWNRIASGESRPEWLDVSVIRNHQGGIQRYVCIYTDLGDQDQIRRHLHQMAYYDNLTGLANRELFQDRLSGAIASAVREKHKIAVMFIDLDRFKEINDSLGHGVGDALLKEVAVRIRACVRASDTVARQGGDEFTVILPSLRRVSRAGSVADKITQALRLPFNLSGHTLHISTSIGIGLYPQDGADAETLVKNADLALYQAKEAGRDNYQFCSKDLTLKAQERFRLEGELNRAIELKEFRVHFQPLFGLERGELVGAEVLLRWQHPTEGLQPPDRFLKVAEDSGLIARIDTWVLTTACRQVMDWQDQGIVLPKISVNISGFDIERTDLAASVRQALEHSGLSADRLELEVSEGFVMSHAERALGVLDEVRQLGVQLAIDDFGTGYSSMAYLKRLPVNRLKIDGSFVADLGADGDHAAITRAIVALGRSLGLTIIAEGIENQAQWDFLRAAGCDEGQGFLSGRPMSAEVFVDWMRERQDMTATKWRSVA